MLPVTIGDESGKPTVTIPGGTAPPQLLVQRLIEGSQRVVGESDYVMVHYRSWSWKTGKIIDTGIGADRSCTGRTQALSKVPAREGPRSRPPEGALHARGCTLGARTKMASSAGHNSKA